MQWFAIIIRVCLLCFVFWIATVKMFLTFTFCAIVSFIFVRNLFDCDFQLDLARIFATKRLGKQNCNGVTPKTLPRSLKECRETAIKNVLRDFVVSWFKNVGVEEQFIVEARTLLVEATEKLYDKIACTDVACYAEKQCIVLHKHLASFQVAKLSLMRNQGVIFKNNEVDFVKAYQYLVGKPGIYKTNELPYLRTLADILLHELVPAKTLGCNNGRFILREILAVDLFLPLLDSLSDPDFVNMSIINVFGDERQDNESIAREHNRLSTSVGKISSISVESSERKKTDSDLHCERNSVDSTSSTKLTVVEKNHSENVDNSTKQNFGSEIMSEASTPNCENPRVKSKINHGTPPATNENCNLNEEHTPFISTSHVEQTMAKANLKSENEKSPQDYVFNNPRMELLTKIETPSNCDKIHGLCNKELSSHSATSAYPVHQTLSKPKLGSKNSKASEENDNGSKVIKAIFGAKIHSGFSMSNKNMECSDASVGENSVEKKTVQSETLYSKGSVGKEHPLPSKLNVAVGDFNLVSSCSPRKQNGEDNLPEMNASENQPLNESSQNLHFEEIIDVADSSEEDLTNTESKTEEAMIDYCPVIKEDKTGNGAELKEFKEIVLTCDDEDVENNFSVKGYDPGVKQPIRSLSSSVEEWDSDMYDEQFQKNRFPEDGNDFVNDILDSYSSNLRESAQKDISSVGEFAIPEVENPYLMISIPSTELVDAHHSWESHIRKYTAYHIVFSLKLWPDQFNNDDADTEQSDSTINQRRINRRYSEFMELHHRLSCGPHASYLKDIPKPNRKFNSPFFRLDLDVIEGRQHLLENYLKCLVNKHAILNCDDLKGFLGIGDQTQINFHRQMLMVEKVPRIDKKLRKEVNKLIDHIKTAFETGPIDGDKEEEYDDIRLVLGEDKTSQDDIRTFEFCTGDCELKPSCCYSGKCFQTYIQQKQEGSDVEHLGAIQGEQELVLKKGKLKSKISKHKRNTAATMSDLETNKDHPLTYPLAVAVLNLSCEVLQKRESWVCLEPVQHAATAVFGHFFEWWFESLASELITEEQWYHYLTILTETIWPQGKLMDSKKVERIEEEKEKTKEEAVQTLSDFFGGALHCAIGTEAMKASSREIVDSLQCQEINRQLLLEVLEVTLAEVLPSIVRGQEVYLSTRSC